MKSCETCIKCYISDYNWLNIPGIIHTPVYTPCDPDYDCLRDCPKYKSSVPAKDNSNQYLNCRNICVADV